MNTKHFDYLITIARTGNLSSASRLLGVSQPVLSRYLSGLEKELGIRLFLWDSNLHRFHITEAGKIYLNGVLRMKELQTQMQRSLNALQGAQAPKLNIGMSPYRGGHELASFYPSLLEHYPSLELVLAENSIKELFHLLLRREITSMINLYDADLLPGTKIASLIRSELLLVLPNFHPLCEGKTATLQNPARLTAEQLRSLNDVLFVISDTASIIGQVIEQLFSHYRFSPHILLRTGNAIAISSLLASGTYAGFQMQNAAVSKTDICFFHLPEPLYLSTGMIFLNDYSPTEVEQYLYCLEYRQALQDTPNLIAVNELGKTFLASAIERI